MDITYNHIDADIVYADNAFTAEELLQIRTIGDSLESAGVVDASTGQDGVRKVWLTFLEHNTQTDFIYKKINAVAKKVSTEFFGIDITQYNELGFWYSTYSSTDHYAWHADKTEAYVTKNTGMVKLSLITQISDPSEYEGGTVEIMSDDGIKTIDKRTGLIYAIPGYTAHRVTPITSGQRRVLVSWFLGPKFR